MARRNGVSMDLVPTPSAFDEEMEYDPDADIRVGRFERAEIHAARAERATSLKDAAKQASNLDALNTPSPATATEAASAADV